MNQQFSASTYVTAALALCIYSMESWAREKAVERLEEKDRIKAIKKAAAAAILAGETGEVVAFKGNSES